MCHRKKVDTLCVSSYTLIIADGPPVVHVLYDHAAGGMAEWTIAAVLKTAEAVRSPGVRIPLPPLPQRRQTVSSWGGARVDDWGRLLSGCGVNNSTEGSNPSLPAKAGPLSS